MWKLDQDEDYFQILDSRKQIAGYFDPDYGENKRDDSEHIENMIKNHEKISGGFIMLPLVKFTIFDSDLDIDINTLESKIKSVNDRIKNWKSFITSTNNHVHSIRISHTDQDMLSITFPIMFSEPTPLDKNEIIKELSPTLDLLQKLGLL